MTLQECYAAMGGNYEEVLGRLRSDRLIQKFVMKFVNDSSYQLSVSYTHLTLPTKRIV